MNSFLTTRLKMHMIVKTGAPVIALWTSWTTRFLRSTIFSKSTPHPVCLGFGTLLSLRTPTWPIGVGGAQCSNRLSYDQIFWMSLKCHRPSQEESVCARFGTLNRYQGICLSLLSCSFAISLSRCLATTTLSADLWFKRAGSFGQYSVLLFNIGIGSFWWSAW